MKGIYPLLHRAVHKAPSGASTEQIAEALHKNPASLAQEVSPDYPNRKFGVEHLAPLIMATGDYAPLDYLARESGCVLMRMPEAKRSGHPVHVQCMDSVQKFGELMTSCSDALKDGKITSDEADALDESGYEAIRGILMLLQEARHAAKEDMIWKS